MGVRPPSAHRQALAAPETITVAADSMSVHAGATKSRLGEPGSREFQRASSTVNNPTPHNLAVATLARDESGGSAHGPALDDDTLVVAVGSRYDNQATCVRYRIDVMTALCSDSFKKLCRFTERVNPR